MANNTELLKQVLKEVQELKEMVNTFNQSKQSKNYQKPLFDSTNKEFKTFPKDVVLYKEMLKVNTNDKTEQFIMSILNNNYPSITEGQKKVMDKIKEDLNL